MNNGFGKFGSIFGGGIKPEEIESIKQFNYQLESGVPVGKAWQDTMSGCRSVVKQAAVDVRSGATSLGELEQSAQKSTAGLIGTRIAATALNMAISMGLALAVQLLITGFQKLGEILPTVENTSKWLEESSQEVQDVQDRIEELNTELKTTQERILELEGKGSLTIVEQNELDRLRQTNAELEREIELEERRLKVSQSKNAKNFVEAVKAKQNQSTSQYGNNYGDTETRASRDINGKWRNGDKWHTKSDGDANQKETFELRLKDYKDADKKYQKALEDGNLDEAQKWKDRKQMIDDAMSGYTSDLQGYLDDLGEYDYSTLSDEAKATVDYIQDAQNKYMMATGSNGESVFSSIFNSGRFEQGRKAIQSLGETGQITADSLSDLYESNQYVKDMIDNMVEVGFLADTSHDSFDALVGDISRLNSGLNAISETSSQSKQDLKTFFTTLNEDKDKKKSKNLANEIKSGELGKYIENLTDEEAQVASYFTQKAEDSSKLDLSFIKKTVEGYRKARKEYDSLVADAVQNGTGNNEKIQAAYENLLQYVGAIETIDIKTEIEDIGKFNTALNESVSATGLSEESISALKSRFQDLKGYDPSVLFEKTSGGVHLNTEALEGLENQFESTQKILIDNKLQDLIADYNSLQLQIDNCTDAGKLSELQSKRNAKYEEIQSTKELQAEYAALTSAYNKWQQAKSGGDERDKYSNMGDSYAGTKELIEQGWADDSEVTKYLDLMLNADKRTKDNIKDFDLLTQKIKGTDFNIMDFFQYDEDNKLTSEGLFNFLDAVKQKLGDEYVQIDEAGNYAFDFTGKKIDKVSKALGMSTEAVQIFEQALSDAGFNVVFSDTDKMITSAREHAESAIDKLEELQNKGKLKISGFKLEDFDVDETKVENLNKQITNAGLLLDKFRNKDGTVNLKLEGAMEAQQLLVTLIANKQTLEAPTIMNIDTTKLDESDKDIGTAIADVQEFINLTNQIELEKSLKIDTTKTSKKLTKAAKKLTPEVLAKVNIKDDKVKKAIENIKGTKIKAGVSISQKSIDTVKEAVKGIKTKDLKIGTNSKKVTKDLKTIQDYTIEDKTFSVSVTGATEAYNSISNINSQLAKLKDGSITITTHTKPKGSAKVTGSAFAQGNWGTKTGGTALFGELGREIIVDPISGSWHTVGDTGAEFAKYRKGSIIFNHKQTEELLGKGHTGRGKAFVGGNAFLNDGGRGIGGKRNGGKTHSASDTSSSKKDTSKTDTKTKSDTKTKTKSDTKSSSNEDKKLKSFQDWVGKFVDWIEVRLSRIQRKIDNAIQRAENYADNGKFAQSAKQYRKAINETQKLINANTAGDKRYRKQADKTISKGLSTGIINKKQANDIKKKVANGTIDIKKYNERQREVIKEYQSFYEKSLDCKDALIDLNEKMEEYYEKLYNLPLDEAARKIDKLSASLNVISKRADAASGGSRILLNTMVSDAKANKNAANTAKNNAQKKVDSKADDLLDSLSGKAKKKAKKKIKKGKKVSLKGLKGKALKRAKAYNAAIDSRKIANQEAKDANKAYNDAVKMRDKYKGQPSYMYENYLLGEETKNAKNQNQANQVAMRKASKNLTAAEQRKAKADANVKKYKKGTKAYKKAVAEQKAAAKALRAARQANTTATQNAAESEAEYVKTLQDNTKAMGDNILKYHESIRAINSATKGLYDAQNSLKETQGKSLTTDDYTGLVANAQKDITDAQKAYDDYLNWYNNNSKNLSDEDKRSAQAELLNLQAAVVGANQALQELENAKVQIPFDNLNTGIEILDALRNRLSAFVSLQNALGKDEGSQSYLEQMVSANEQAEKANAQYAEALANAQKARENGGYYGGKSIEQWQKEANGYLSSEYKYLQESKEIAVQLAEYLEEPFEKAIKRIEHFADIINGLGDLIDDEMIYDEDGKLTKHGITQISLLVGGYESARDKIAEYSAELEQVNQNYVKGYYNAEEYQAKVEELNQSMLSGAKDMKTALDEITKMYKEMAQTELDNLFELIDLRQKALDKKKSYYEYDKSIRDKNKSIQSLESEIAALNGLSDAASKAKRAKLMSDLSEAQEDLDDTLKDHYFEISSDSLDEMKDKLQEGFDETWKKISQDITEQAKLLAKAQDVATSSVNTVNRNLQALLGFYGVPSHNAEDIINTHYASGTRSVPANLHAWVNENGQELITSNKGTITPLAKGDGVIPANLTDRLIDLANGNMVNALNISDFNVPKIEIDNLGSVTQHYDSLINIEGSADAATVEDLKKYGKEFLEKSYLYTSNKMSRGARKGGGKRQI